ncbi:MAG: hypothetical protein ACXQTO_01215, partial [Candidatus Syntropharchaeales archaeon]
HDPDESQVKELEDKFGNVEIDRMTKNIRSAKDIIADGAIDKYDAIVTILPEYIDMQLVRAGIFPIKSTRTNNVHMGFRVLTNVVVESKSMNEHYDGRICDICGELFADGKLRDGICDGCWNEHEMYAIGDDNGV